MEDKNNRLSLVKTLECNTRKQCSEARNSSLKL